MYRSYSSEFERMDVDGDDTISYPEAVVYVRQMGEIEPMKNYLVDHLSGGIASTFGFELEADSEESLGLFLEYAAVVMYFGTYDVDLKGYIRHEDFTAIAAKSEWDSLPTANATLSRDAFFDVLYGTSHYSWNGALHQMSGGDAEQTVSDWAAVEAPREDTVRKAEISLSPILLLRDAERQQEATATGFRYVYSQGRAYLECVCVYPECGEATPSVPSPTATPTPQTAKPTTAKPTTAKPTTSLPPTAAPISTSPPTTTAESSHF